MATLGTRWVLPRLSKEVISLPFVLKKKKIFIFGRLGAQIIILFYDIEFMLFVGREWLGSEFRGRVDEGESSVWGSFDCEDKDSLIFDNLFSESILAESSETLGGE